MNNEQIKELMETNWDDHFTPSQSSRIERGLINNLDVSIYAKSKFSHLQMEEIIKGLQEDLDVSIYAKSKFNEEQMKEIRLGLQQGLDVSLYLDSNFSSLFMSFLIDNEIKRRENKENE